jgi:hypothetical protein
MDPAAMRTHLEALLGAEKETLSRLESHQAKLLTHHDSKERTRALKQVTASLRRHDKMRRRLERALAVQR